MAKITDLATDDRDARERQSGRPEEGARAVGPDLVLLLAAGNKLGVDRTERSRPDERGQLLGRERRVQQLLAAAHSAAPCQQERRVQRRRRHVVRTKPFQQVATDVAQERRQLLIAKPIRGLGQR